MRQSSDSDDPEPKPIDNSNYWTRFEQKFAGVSQINYFTEANNLSASHCQVLYRQQVLLDKFLKDVHAVTHCAIG